MAIKQLTYNKKLIKNTLGTQGSSQCGIYAVAYGWTILEKSCRVSGKPASNKAVAKAYNGGHSPTCYWSIMGVSSNTAKSAKARYAAIINNINNGKPVVVAVKGTGSNHYVCVIGYTQGKNSGNIKPSDFYIIDPAGCNFGFYGSTTFTKSHNSFNGSSYGLQYITFSKSGVKTTTGNATNSAEHPKSWYIEKYGTGAKVYFELKSYGYSHKACCAVLGNMEQESGIRVYTGGSYDGNGSEGLCQWTFGRKTAMQKYAKQHSASKTWKSVDGQVAYLVYELEHTETATNKVLKNNSLTLAEMTEQFEKKFERAEVPNMKARISYAKKWDSRMSGAGDGDGEYLEEYTYVDMQTRSSQLYSSANYKWVASTEEETELDKTIAATKSYITTLLNQTKETKPEQYYSSGAVEGIAMGSSKTKERVIKTKNNILSISDALIETPYIEVLFGKFSIGTYNGSIDKYPNYIQQLNVTKTNGQINQYEIHIIHQVRPGEDPNIIDKLISGIRYNEITIRYGDLSSSQLYNDTKAIITNVVMDRDYASYKISYTIYATSAGELITSYKLNFSSKITKPSTVLYSLLYDNAETSDLLLEAFPGMKNKSAVASMNLIPDNDTILDIDSMENVNCIEYINYLVSCMSNASNENSATIRNSTYYITYENDYDNTMGGSYFKISEVKNTSSSVSNYSNNIYEINVGYPDSNYVMNFNVDNDIAWSILYNNYNVSDEYIYKIDNSGNKSKDYSPNLMSSTSLLTETQKNWWTQMTSFPINASLTLRGLLKPIMLMDYIIVNVIFYGQKHITSGVYVVTGQKDSVSGDGFRTTLALTRVGAN